MSVYIYKRSLTNREWSRCGRSCLE